MEKRLRNANQIVAIFFICPRGGHLGFQNGRHFEHVLAYISSSEPQNELLMVAIPKFVIPWIVTKTHRKLLVIFLSAAILDFKMAAILKHNLAYISTSELPRKLKIVAIPMFVTLSIATKSHKMLLVIVLLAAILDFKMAAI